jgi:hypothetical protein
MGWLWLGLLIGLLVGAGAVLVLLRAVGRLTGTDRRSLARLVVDGLTPGVRTDGVAAQRALARRLKHAGERTASGRRVAAERLTVHVSPEDHDAIAGSLGVDAAEQDLAEFYRGHAASGRWIVAGEPVVHLVKDISLRPRQAFVRTATRGVRPAAEEVPVDVRRVPDAAGPRDDDAVTDVLPRADEDATSTAVYPRGLLLGDLVVVHGTDVRTVTTAEGALRIGRGPHNDLVLDRPGVGRDHVVIEARGDAWWIVPGTSPGGTKLDGAPLDGEAVVRSGSTLELGRGVRLRLQVETL